jgi:hypothetical protein
MNQKSSKRIIGFIKLILWVFVFSNIIACKNENRESYIWIIADHENDIIEGKKVKNDLVELMNQIKCSDEINFFPNITISSIDSISDSVRIKVPFNWGNEVKHFVGTYSSSEREQDFENFITNPQPENHVDIEKIFQGSKKSIDQFQEIIESLLSSNRNKNIQKSFFIYYDRDANVPDSLLFNQRKVPVYTDISKLRSDLNESICK